MENTIGNIQKVITMIGIMIVALSLAYFLVYRPYNKELVTKQCHQWVSDQTKNSYNKEKVYDDKFKQCLNEYGQ